MSSNIKILVVIPVYNGAAYLRETLQSVQSQDCNDWFCVVVNDGSTDNSSEIAEDFKNRYPDKFEVLHTRNNGEAAAINFGLSAFQSDYVLALSADDLLHPTLLTKSTQVLQSTPSIVATYPDWVMINQSGKVLRNVKTQKFSRKSLVTFLECLPGPGALIRRSAIKRVDLRKTQFRFVSDLEAWIYLSQYGDFQRIPAKLASWRIHNTNGSGLAKGKLYIKEFIELFDLLNISDEYAQIRDWNLIAEYGLQVKIFSQLAYETEKVPRWPIVKLCFRRDVISTQNPKRFGVLLILILRPILAFKLK